MITLTTKSPDLSTPFADVLNVDTIQDLKDGLGMMGMRFTGKPSTEKSMKTPLDSVLFEVSSKCREIIAYINKWSKGNKLRGMSFKELDRLSDTLFDYEDELDEYQGKLTSLIAATPQGFAARQEDIDSLMTVVGHVRHTIFLPSPSILPNTLL